MTDTTEGQPHDAPRITRRRTRVHPPVGARAAEQRILLNVTRWTPKQDTRVDSIREGDRVTFTTTRDRVPWENPAEPITGIARLATPHGKLTAGGHTIRETVTEPVGGVVVLQVESPTIPAPTGMFAVIVGTRRVGRQYMIRAGKNPDRPWLDDLGHEWSDSKVSDMLTDGIFRPAWPGESHTRTLIAVPRVIDTPDV